MFQSHFIGHPSKLDTSQEPSPIRSSSPARNVGSPWSVGPAAASEPHLKCWPCANNPASSHTLGVSGPHEPFTACSWPEKVGCIENHDEMVQTFSMQGNEDDNWARNGTGHAATREVPGDKGKG